MAMMNGRKKFGYLPPLKDRILRLLLDGRPHSRREIHGLMNDDLQPLSHIKTHISEVRKVLRPKGYDILCEIWNRTVHYRMVRLICSYDE